jgi:large subunit ribosomal protein L22
MAVANAKSNFNTSSDRLYVREIKVDEGTAMKRMMPRARGSAYTIKKRSSHISVVLDTKGEELISKVLKPDSSKQVEESLVEETQE